MSSADPERKDDAWVPEHVAPRPPEREYHGLARQAMAAELERGEPCRADRETMLAARRDVWALSKRWAHGLGDTGPAAAAEVQDAIRGVL